MLLPGPAQVTGPGGVGNGIPQGGPLTQNLDANGFDMGSFGELVFLGVPGAAAPGRLRGFTLGGAPVTGTFAESDVVFAPDGIWYCTVAGSPGTFINLGGSGGGGGLGVYGDGSYGSAVLDGVATYPGFLSLSAGVYTCNVDIYVSNLTINSGITLKPNGFKIFCAGTITGVDATSIISDNGNGGGTSSGGGGLVNGNSPINGSNRGQAGGNGGTTTGSAGSGTSTSPGGSGGQGGTGPSGAGGGGGTASGIGASSGGYRNLPVAAVGGLTTFNGSGSFRFQFGAGGGGGGGDGANSGGGGGGGGGVVLICARAFAGTGKIQARGAAGGTPTVGNTGGGGGGGGGTVWVTSGSVSGGAVSGWTIDANGGAAGAPHGTGTNNAAAGSNGSTILIPN